MALIEQIQAVEDNHEQLEVDIAERLGAESVTVDETDGHTLRGQRKVEITAFFEEETR